MGLGQTSSAAGLHIVQTLCVGLDNCGSGAEDERKAWGYIRSVHMIWQWCYGVLALQALESVTFEAVLSQDPRDLGLEQKGLTAMMSNPDCST